jgi:hypothetical protein
VQFVADTIAVEKGISCRQDSSREGDILWKSLWSNKRKC